MILDERRPRRQSGPQRDAGRGYEYFILWAGYPELEASWEPRAHSNCRRLVSEFRALSPESRWARRERRLRIEALQEEARGEPNPPARDVEEPARGPSPAPGGRE